MDDKAFNELLEGAREAAAHLRGEIEIEPSRIHFVGEPKPRETRPGPHDGIPRAEA